MQPNILHIKPTRLSKAATLLQSMPPPEEEKERFQTWDYTRSHALQNQIEEAFMGRGTPPPGMRMKQFGPGDFEYVFSTAIEGHGYIFDVGVANGILSMTWSRDSGYLRNEDEKGSQVEIMKALSILMNMTRYVFNKHRHVIKEASFGADPYDPGKIKLYGIMAKKFASEVGGKVEYQGHGYYIVHFPPMEGTRIEYD